MRDDRAERRRALVIGLFVVGSIAVALAIAFFYGMPAAGGGY